MIGKNLHDETRRLLRERPKTLSLRQIAEDTGLGVEWIKKVLYEEDMDPGVNKVQTLYEYLAKPGAAA